MKIQLKHRLLVAFSLLLIVLVFTGYQYILTPNICVEKEDTYLYITKGTTFKKLLRFTTDEGIVTAPISFAFMSKVMDYQTNIKPGRYLLRKNMTNIEAIRYLRNGRQEPVKMRFSNARLIEDLPSKISKNTLTDSTSLLALMKDPTVVEAYGFDTNTFISMFIPNTYFVYWDIEPKALLDRLKHEYTQFWNEQRLEKAKTLGLTPIEVSTLASIVQAETNRSDEKPKVAGLYLNRLRKGIALQADPTLKFSHKDFGLTRLLDIHKEIDSPYNTYKYRGLPPGPINMPAISSIDAVLNAEEHEFIYMCGKGDCSGYHNFARTNNEHNNNRVIYKRNLRKGGC